MNCHFKRNEGNQMDSIQHDLTNEELWELIRLSPKNCSRWHWIRSKAGSQIRNVEIVHDGNGITSVQFQGDFDSATVVRSAFDALSRRRDRRRESSRRGAETRKKRRELLVYEIAKAITEGRNLAATRCRLCGKKITDELSRQRGIGSDCWQEIMKQIEATKEGTT